MSVSIVDSRRLTGANQFWDKPSAIIDLTCDESPHDFIGRWEKAARVLLNAVGHAQEQCCFRLYEGGASVLISAPIDGLYSMCELNELAAGMARGSVQIPDEHEIEKLRECFSQEARPELLAMQAAAEQHGVPFLWDDDFVSIGHGASAQVWAADSVPDAGTIHWQEHHSIPVALVTGTNGKSTTVRMSASILASAGLRAGLTSTDWIRVGSNILDTGDYSGTGGARTLLRHPDTQVAVLETARGGLLRRGLGVDTASAALITNVAADHLGEYGINTVSELREAKFIVRRALPEGAPLILNADDEGLVAFAESLPQQLKWFSLDPNHPVIRRHLANGGQAAVLDEGWLQLRTGESQAQAVVCATEIPATFGGAARHNVRNALGSMLLCHTLGVEHPALAQGLRNFRGDSDDNPGRGNWFEANGIKILVDFAHNEHGLIALADMLMRLDAKRRLVLLSQAGDRTDDQIEQMTRVVCQMEPQRLLVCELPGYERGRPPEAVPRLIHAKALQSGMTESQISAHPGPLEAARQALSEARPGDLIILLALTQRQQVLDLVNEFVEAA